jgi:DNA-binding response OmpR family regulator
METILLIDDDEQLVLLLRAYLKNSDYEILIARDGKEGIDLFKENPDKISLIIVDMSMPVLNGLEVCRIIRGKFHYTNIPILMLTSMASIEDKYLGFNSGADDYLVKPFEPLELLLRIKSLLKKVSQKEIKQAKKNSLTGVLDIDIKSQKVKSRGQEIYLSRLEFDLIRFLSENPDRPIPPEEIFEKVFEYSPTTGTTDTVRTHMRNLRVKIEDDPANPKIITNIPKRGYFFNTKF